MGKEYVEESLYSYLIPMSVHLNAFLSRQLYEIVEWRNGEANVQALVASRYPDLADLIANGHGDKVDREARQQVLVREFDRMMSMVQATCEIIELLLKDRVNVSDLTANDSREL